MTKVFSKQEAKVLAKFDRHYVIRRVPGTDDYVVWDSVSDHAVEFDNPEAALRAVAWASQRQ